MVERRLTPQQHNQLVQEALNAELVVAAYGLEAARYSFRRIYDLFGWPGVFASTCLWAGHHNDVVFDPAPPGALRVFRVDVTGGSVDDTDPVLRLAARVLAMIGNDCGDTAASVYFTEPVTVRIGASLEVLLRAVRAGRRVVA
jgi:hypothetical protein